eukprot:m.31999 g.31999  ORF g.31999 m.31999 type:complete len:289 (+) comp14880_c0_seq1:174-1040(+)
MSMNRTRDEDVPLISSQPEALTPTIDEERTQAAGCHPLACFLQTLCCPLTVGATCLSSFFTVEQRTEAVILRYGRYEKTVKEPGIHFSNVFGRDIKKVDKKIQSVDLPVLGATRRSVLDSRGSPLNVSAVCVYQFVNSHRAVFGTSDPVDFVLTQGEAVLKSVISHFPYESDDGSPCLRSESELVANKLRDELQRKVVVAGVQIHSFSLKEISYAPVIAQAMLKRQQASAVIAARQAIVSGAVGIAVQACNDLRDAGVNLQESDATQVVKNLITVICSESDVQPTLAM